MQKNSKKIYRKIGILGGTFDPPHVGHLFISKQSLKKFKLNKIIWIITKQNPFKKKPLLDKNIRIKLSKNLTKSAKKIFVEYIDDIVKSKNTFLTLKYLKKKNKSIKFYFIMGADNLINFHKWQNSHKIFNEIPIVVFRRYGYNEKALKSYTSNFYKNLLCYSSMLYHYIHIS